MAEYLIASVCNYPRLHKRFDRCADVSLIWA
jgi:hypothetical protein